MIRGWGRVDAGPDAPSRLIAIRHGLLDVQAHHHRRFAPELLTIAAGTAGVMGQNGSSSISGDRAANRSSASSPHRLGSNGARSRSIPPGLEVRGTRDVADDRGQGVAAASTAP